MASRKSKRLIGLRIDIETRSRTEIKFGPYKYTEDPDFRVLVIAFSPIWRFPGGAEKLGQPRTTDPDNPDVNFVAMVKDPRFQKHAFNANFERIGLSKWLGMPNGKYLDPTNWHCSAILANTQGVFGTLDEVARATRSPVKKDAEGKRLIKLFSEPEPRKTSPVYGEFHSTAKCKCGADHTADFVRFGKYCEQDVLTEAVATSEWPTLDPTLQAEYEMDQRVNDRGFRHFKGLSLAAVEQVKVERDRLMGELHTLTGIENPNSIQQFQAWLDENDYSMVSLDKAHREEALLDPRCPPHVKEALTLKGAASLSSVAKHQAALDRRCEDGRVRGSLRYYGAHTGREAGSGMQPQNLPRYEAPPAHRKALLLGLIEYMHQNSISVANVAKGTVRASIVPAKDHVFVGADYNAIEARVLAGLCGEKWAQAEFQGEGKIYEATADQMGFMPKAKLLAGLKACGKCGDLACIYCAIRARSKVSNLALGYNGGAGALVTMGAEEAGVDIGNYAQLHAEWTVLGKPGGKFWEWNRDLHDYPELIRLRDLYRAASPATVGFWKQCGRAWDVAALQGKTAKFGNGKVLTMMRDGRHNRMVLPSGRSIWYRFARSLVSDTNPDRIERRTFIGKSAGVGHVRTDTHGGKLTENVTQAVARDVLFDLMTRIEAEHAKGWPGRLVLHVHDEVVLEVPRKQAEQVLADTIGMMSQTPEWGDFLVVKGEGAIMERYRK